MPIFFVNIIIYKQKMVRLSRRSRISQERNRRQSQRRGGRPNPKAKAEPLTLITGRDGSFCAEKPENDCKKIKACDWMAPNDRQKKGYCRSRQDRGTGESSQEFKDMEARIQARRAAALKEVYESDEDSPMPPAPQPAPSSLVVYKGKRSTSPKKPRSLSPKKARSSPMKAKNAPTGCVQKQYEMTSAKGKSFKSSRCVDSKDPNVNDDVNCMVNTETNKCKNRVRA